MISLIFFLVGLYLVIPAAALLDQEMREAKEKKQDVRQLPPSRAIGRGIIFSTGANTLCLVSLAHHPTLIIWIGAVFGALIIAFLQSLFIGWLLALRWLYTKNSPPP